MAAVTSHLKICGIPNGSFEAQLSMDETALILFTVGILELESGDEPDRYLRRIL